MKPISIRDVWEHEVSDFTPWLACEENLQALGSILDLSLRLQAQETHVGSYTSDIVAVCTHCGQRVVIENQLERTDHRHLGQLITYAAGLQAGVLVWVAPRFTKGHQRALDWLHEMTPKSMRFFGVEIQVQHIGDSEIVAQFRIVCQPGSFHKGDETDVTRDIVPPVDTYANRVEQLYRANSSLSVSQVVSHLGCSRSTAHKWLQRVKTVATQRRLPKVAIDRIEALYQDNHAITVTEIVEQVGCSRSTAAKWLGRVKVASPPTLERM